MGVLKYIILLQFQCCGVTGTRDYAQIFAGNASVPESCCKEAALEVDRCDLSNPQSDELFQEVSGAGRSNLFSQVVVLNQ
jgi:hypothetical protein